MSETILCIDPGTFESAYVLMERDKIHEFGKPKNDLLLTMLEDGAFSADHLALEMMDARGTPMGYETLRTLVWCGQFRQEFGRNATTEINRSRVKATICGAAKNAKDSNIRQAMIDRWGGDSVAIGGVKCEDCKGRGTFGFEYPRCDVCCGSGRVEGKVSQWKKCPACKGSCVRRGDPAKCQTCDGSTWKFPPGPLNGFTKDCWQALAVGVTFFELHADKLNPPTTA